MNKDIDLSKSGHALSPFTKKLNFVSEEDGLLVYSVSDGGHLRIGYNDDIIDYIDFDGGPFLRKGSYFWANDKKYNIDKFTHDGNFNDIKVYLKENDLSN